MIKYFIRIGEQRAKLEILQALNERRLKIHSELWENESRQRSAEKGPVECSRNGCRIDHQKLNEERKEYLKSEHLLLANLDNYLKEFTEEIFKDSK